MLNQFKALHIEPVQFTPASLWHIQQTTYETLCRYLEQYDPHDHELRFGRVSGLLDVLEQFGISHIADAGGVTQSLDGIRSRAYRFLELLSRAPVANPESISAFRSTLRQARIEASAQNLYVYSWDLWELRALASGAPPDLAEMGRGALRRQHFCEKPIEELEPGLLLSMVVNSPHQAEAMFMRLLVHSSLANFSDLRASEVARKTYN